jgi:predicted nucleic acid-binding protein
MRDFLIDTNVWAYWFAPSKYPNEYKNIQERLGCLPSTARLSISVITLGEIAVGISKEFKKDSSVQVQHLKFIYSQRPSIIEVDKHMAEKYGELRGLLSNRKRQTGKLVDRDTWLELGSLENDLWIVAQAMSRNLTLVTNDKLCRINEVTGKKLNIENWAKKLKK